MSEPRLNPLADDGEIQTSLDELNESTADPIIVFDPDSDTRPMQKIKPKDLLDQLNAIADQVNEDDIKALIDILTERADSLSHVHGQFKHSPIRTSVLKKMYYIFAATGIGSFATIAEANIDNLPTEVVVGIVIFWLITITLITYSGVWIHLVGKEKDMLREILKTLEGNSSLIDLEQDQIRYILKYLQDPSEQRNFSIRTLAIFKDKLNPALQDLLHYYHEA